MLASKLYTTIDRIWDSCWPVNHLKPLALLDLIGYLFFIKKLDETQLLAQWYEAQLKNGLFSKNDPYNFSWNKFSNMNPQTRLLFFKKENGIMELVKKYSESNMPYSIFIRAPLLLMPTAGLLENAVELVTIIEAQEKETRGALFTWLLNKRDIQAANGQVYIPDYINKLVIAMIQPVKEEIIWDPQAGNGSLLVKSIEYIAATNSVTNKILQNDLIDTRYNGTEEDLVQLRIAAMNMILHGISEPALGVADEIDEVRFITNPPTLVLANLFFNNPEVGVIREGSGTERKRLEIYLLHRILKSLQKGGRAAVVIREFVLHDNLSEMRALRQQIVDYYNLEAVVFLPGNSGSLFSNGCLLIFSQPNVATIDKVWFCKMERVTKGENKNDMDFRQMNENVLNSFIGEDEQIKDILTKWEDAKKGIALDTENSRCVSLGEIRNNDYSLSFRYNSSIVNNQELPKQIINNGRTDVATKNNTFNNTTMSGKRKFPVVLASLLIVAVILASYFMFYKNSPAVATLAKKPSDTSLSKSYDTTISGSSLKTSKAIGDESKKNAKEPPVQKQKKPVKKPITSNTPASTTSSGRERYTVKTIAYFHDQPDESTRRNAFINHWNNAVLIPKDEKNGFVYIEYTNAEGQTSKGWLDKKDLKLLPQDRVK